MTSATRRRGAGLLLAVAGLLAGAAPAAAAELCLRGVNLSGAEFGTVPGRADTDYTHPTEAAIRRLAGLGMTSFRLPFRWERIQPKLGEELDAAELARLDRSIDTARAAGLVAILDLHNFGYYAGKKLGSPELPASTLADVWRRLATHYRDRTNVVFSIMNEPYDIHSAEWAKIQNVAIAAIRKTRARQMLLVTGTAYGGAHSWTADLPVGNNGRDLLAIDDPLKRFAYDFHQYLDADYSGRQPECSAAQGALKAIDDVTAWLKAHGRQGFLGEFAASDRPECVKVFREMTARLDSRPQQWIGWAAWGAGPWWPADYVFNLEPIAAGERPQMKALIEQLKTKEGEEQQLWPDGAVVTTSPAGMHQGIGKREGVGLREGIGLREGLRIVHVVRQFLPNRGGLEDVVANLCRAQLRMGFKPSVVTLDRLFSDPGRLLEREEVIDGIPVRRIPYRGSQRYPLAPSVFAHLSDADIVHVHAIDFFFDALALGWVLHRKPLVATTHGGFFHTRDFSGLKTIWMKGPTRLSSLAYRGIAGCSANDARMFETVAPGKVRLIENGVDLDKFRGASSPDPVRRLVSIGRFSKNKRPENLIATMNELQRAGADWHLDMIGVESDWSEAALREAVARAGLVDRINIHVGLDDAGARDVLGRASLFVSASDFEGFGLSLIEAMSAGLIPIVQPNAAFAALSAAYPVIRLADFAAPSKAAGVIAEAFASLDASHGALKPDIGALAPYSWQQVALTYQAFYEDALGRRPGR